jgi:hypothetical protein
MNFNISEGMTFDTLETAEREVQAAAKKVGFAVYRRSSGGLKESKDKRSPFVKLACIRSGHHTLKQKAEKRDRNESIPEDTDKEEKTKKKDTRDRGTRKNNCKFMLRIIQCGNEWKVSKMDNQHNHPFCDEEGVMALPAHRKLTTEQNMMIANSLLSGADTFSTVKAINSLYPNCPETTVKDVINKKAMLRDPLDRGRNKLVLTGLIQALETKGYIYTIKRNEKDELTHLFFFHPSCLEQVCVKQIWLYMILARELFEF